MRRMIMFLMLAGICFGLRDRPYFGPTADEISRAIANDPIPNNSGGFNRYRRIEIIQSFDFDDTGWSAPAASGTGAFDTTNYHVSDGATPRSYKVTPTVTSTYSTARRDDAGTLDLSTSQIILKCYIYPGTIGQVDSWKNTASLYLYLYGPDTGDLVYYPWIFNWDVASPPHYYPGWHTFCWTFDDADYAAMATIKRIECRLYNKAAEQQTAVTWDWLAFVKPPATGFAMITFDGWYSEDYKCAAYLAAKGIRGVFYGDPSLVDTTGHLTLAQLKEIKRMGHMIALYTGAHRMFVTNSVTAEQATRYIVEDQRWFYKHGFTEGARHLALSGGSPQWPDGFDMDFLDHYADTIRFVFAGGEVSRTQGIYDLRKFYCNTFFTATPAYVDADAETRLADTAAGKGLYCVGVHSYEVVTDQAGQNTWANFIDLIDKIIAQQAGGALTIGTPSQYLAKYGQ